MEKIPLSPPFVKGEKEGFIVVAKLALPFSEQAPCSPTCRREVKLQ